MSVDASWLADPSGTHQLRYWNGTAWTEHVSDAGVTATDPPPADLPPPAPAAAPPPPPPPPATAAAGGSWKDKLKAAAAQATAQGKAMADQAKTAVADQQARRTQQWADDPNTLWHGESKTMGSGVTGAMARYRITRDRLWIESGLLGTTSEQVPLWAVRDVDVRQSVMNQSKDLGDLVLHLEDAAYSVDPAGSFSLSGLGGSARSGSVTLDNIEHPYQVYELLQPLISEARAKKLVERQTQYMHVNPGMTAMGVPMGAPQPAAPAAPAAPAVDVADQLRKLAALRDEGLLTDEEFAAQKAKLLGS
ncbi:MAG: PH domain-containing protein [Actinomycetia bacterium]|nr:PH domain-containing protein [Actinomycetes bacterium]